jgi:two-component system, LuxR family, response regulator FixJ
MTFESAQVFLESGLAPGPACLILDILMPGMDGPELQLRLNSGHSRIPIVFITAHDDGPLRERVRRAGAAAVLNKPFAPTTLLATIRMALEERVNATSSSSGG